MVSTVPMVKKLVLLVDVNSKTREPRAKVMRTLGVTVHCVSNTRLARSKIDSNAYDLILVDLGTDNEGADAWVRQIRESDPKQLVAFLVGRPRFVSTSLNRNVTRPSNALQTAIPVAVARVRTLGTGALDFGQRIRDAEGEKVA